MKKKHLAKANMIKTLSKPGTEGIFFNLINGIYDKPTTNIILNSEILDVFPLRSGARQGCPFSSLVINTVLVVLARAIGQRKEIKSTQIGKEEVKLCLFTDAMILYVENHKELTKNYLNE